jgi:hypothetical protein
MEDEQGREAQRLTSRIAATRSAMSFQWALPIVVVAAVAAVRACD